MHRRIKDKAAPKTGGVTNRAYPTVALCFDKVYQSLSKFIPTHRDRAGNPSGRIMRNEPNLRLPQPGPRSKYAKRTQFSFTNCPTTPQKCKTNPTSAAGYPKNAKRTQFTFTDTLPARQICETNPIPARQTANRQKLFFTKRTQFQPDLTPIYAKRTQFTAHPQSTILWPNPDIIRRKPL